MRAGDRGIYVGDIAEYSGVKCLIIETGTYSVRVKFSDDFDFWTDKENVELIVEKAQHKEQFNAITPAHYKKGGIDTIDFTSTFFTKEEISGAYRFNVIKYVQRFKDKNGLEDLKKAQFYLEKLIQLEGKENGEN